MEISKDELNQMEEMIDLDQLKETLMPMEIMMISATEQLIQMEDEMKKVMWKK